MGLGGIGLWRLIIVLRFVVLIFGTKRLGNIGADLGGAVKGFRKSMSDSDTDDDNPQLDKQDAEFSDNAAETSETDTNQKA